MLGMMAPANGSQQSSLSKKSKVISLHGEGHSFRIIKKKWKERNFDIPLTTIHRIVHQNVESGSATRKIGYGRKKALISRDKRKLAKMTSNDRNQTIISLFRLSCKSPTENAKFFERLLLSGDTFSFTGNKILGHAKSL